ncbi:MAG: hypothetical protein PHF00_01235 [Elusimicrobia bacterium]|nr:hypothetical protein [Elusimicrobiota bacterium]
MRLWKRRRPGQAMTETVLLFPLFMFFLFAFAKVYALLILVQKVEIASYYAARRWQLESHRNINYMGDDRALERDIEHNALAYVGYGGPHQTFLGLAPTCGGSGAGLSINRTQVWQQVTLTVCTGQVNLPFYKSAGFKFETTKYVPNRDRPIAFILPGLQQ